MSAWIRVALVVIALFFPRGTPTLKEIVTSVVTSPEGFIFFVAYSAAGAGFALLVFATSVVSIPMLLDREKMDALSAMIVSFNAVKKNFLPLLLWAGIIVVLVTLGFVSWFAGLSVGGAGDRPCHLACVQGPGPLTCIGPLRPIRGGTAQREPPTPRDSSSSAAYVIRKRGYGSMK